MEDSRYGSIAMDSSIRGMSGTEGSIHKCFRVDTIIENDQLSARGDNEVYRNSSGIYRTWNIWA